MFALDESDIILCYTYGTRLARVGVGEGGKK